MRLHLFAHNAKNYVKKGDWVKAYGDWIGRIGSAENYYYSHLHYSVSEGLTPDQIKAYVRGWSMDNIKKYYREPQIDRSKMFERPVDNGQAGYDWLQAISKGYWHPGRDYNGFGGGDTDYGYKFKSPVNGVVVYSGDWGIGWGKVLIIEEKEMYYVDSKLRSAIEGITGKKYKDKMQSEKIQEQVADDLEEFSEKAGRAYRENALLREQIGGYETIVASLTESQKQLILDQDKINIAHDLELERIKNTLSKECNDEIERIIASYKIKLTIEPLTWREILEVIKTKLTNLLEK